MSLFKKAKPDHPIYATGSFVQTGVAPEQKSSEAEDVTQILINAAQQGDAEQVRFLLQRMDAGAVSAASGEQAMGLAEDEEWEVARLLLAVWAASLPVPRPFPGYSRTGQTFLLRLEQPLAHPGIEKVVNDKEGHELLDASNHYAGLTQYVLPIENDYRIYVERCWGDRFVFEPANIYAVGQEWRKTKIPKCDREAVRCMIEKGRLDELCYSPEEDDVEPGENNPYEITTTGPYGHFFRRSDPDRSRY